MMMASERQRTRTEDFRPAPFEHDGMLVRVTPYANYEYGDSTLVFTSSSDSDVFHADKHCHRLYQSEPSERPDGTVVEYLYAKPLPKVMTTWGLPRKPCSYCTQNIYKTAEIVVEHDNVPESLLKYYEPGDKCYRTTFKRTENGTEVVSESVSEVY